MTTLAERMTADDLLIAPGVIDPFTARIVESLGFGAVYLGGNAMGLHLGIGQPLVTMTEALGIASQVAGAIQVPVILDGEAGFGAGIHVHRLVRECERIGVAALQIDDQSYPKQAGYHRGKGSVADVSQVADKLSAASAARVGSEITLIARTDSWRLTKSLDEVVARCRLYADAGADVLMILDLEPADLVSIRGDLPPLPIAWIGGVKTPCPATAELADAGFSAALYPFNTIAAIAGAVTSLWSDFRSSGRPSQSEDFLARWRAETLELIPMREYWAIEDNHHATAGKTE